mgnify:CR=1 FL=1
MKKGVIAQIFLPLKKEDSIISIATGGNVIQIKNFLPFLKGEGWPMSGTLPYSYMGKEVEVDENNNIYLLV